MPCRPGFVITCPRIVLTTCSRVVYPLQFPSFRDAYVAILDTFPRLANIQDDGIERDDGIEQDAIEPVRAFRVHARERDAHLRRHIERGDIFNNHACQRDHYSSEKLMSQASMYAT